MNATASRRDELYRRMPRFAIYLRIMKTMVIGFGKMVIATPAVKINRRHKGGLGVEAVVIGLSFLVVIVRPVSSQPHWLELQQQSAIA